MKRIIVFSGKNSDIDYGLTIESFKVSPPVPRKTEITIPFRNSAIDMEKVVGYPVYDDRTITIKIWKKCSGPPAVEALQADITEWFMKSNEKKELEDYFHRGYIYKAYCSQIDYGESTRRVLRCTVTLKADPYRIDPIGQEVF